MKTLYVHSICILLLFLAPFSMASSLCSYFYGPQKFEHTIIYQALSTHVIHKTLTPELTQKAIINFTHILDPNKFLFTEEEVNSFKNLTPEALSALHQEITYTSTRSIHADIQRAATERYNFYFQALTTQKEVREAILKRIPEINIVQLREKIPTSPKNLDQGLYHFMEFMAEYAAALKHDSITNKNHLLTDREALILAIRTLRISIFSEEYLYAHSFLPVLIAKSYIDSLDKHSHFFLPKEHSSFNRRLMTKEFIGLGITSSEVFNGLKVNFVMENSGAQEAGLQKGDIITHVKLTHNQKQEYKFPKDNPQSEWLLIRNIEYDELTHNFFMGEENTQLAVRLLRDNQILEKTITRKIISKADTELNYKLFSTKSGPAAYIEFDSFYVGSSEHLAAKIKLAIKSKAKGLILDLRGNGGGSTNDMRSILGLFLKNGPSTLIQGKDGYSVMQINNDKSRKKPLWTKPLIVLIDKYSASASEGLSGALKDYSRAIIVGADPSSYGKGSVQSVTAINEHISMKITTELFSSPLGGHSQFNGVTPDIVLKNEKEADFKYERDYEDAIRPATTPIIKADLKPFIANKKEIVKALKLALKKSNTTPPSEGEDGNVDINRTKALILLEELIKTTGTN